MDRNLKIQELNSIEKPSDLFDFIWRYLHVPLPQNPTGVIELFSWALGDWEDGPYATDERTILGWLRDTRSSIDRPHSSAEKRSTRGEVKHTLLEEFASAIARNGFQEWDDDSPRPSKRECTFVSEIIVKAVQNKLRRRRDKSPSSPREAEKSERISGKNISLDSPVESDFQRFCRSKIGYFPREHFFEDFPSRKKSTRTEGVVLSDFLSSSVHRYLILHGPGGSGKTSTLNHIASLAERVEAIQIRYVRSSANLKVSDLSELKEGKTYIVFVDYVEKCNNLRDVANWVEDNQHIDIKFVLACRNSSFEKVSTLLNPRRCVGDSINIEYDGKTYQEWIVRKILTKMVGSNVSDSIIRLCGHNPAIAAYFVYQMTLEEQNDEREASHSGVHKLQSFATFKDWLSSRLCLALDKPHNQLGLQVEDAEVAKIFFCLPAPSRMMVLTPALTALIDDGFIVLSSSEEGETLFSPVHDVFADMAISLWLDSAVTPTQRLRMNSVIESIPAFCDQADCLHSFFVALDRLNLSADPTYFWADFSKSASNFISSYEKKHENLDLLIMFINCREIKTEDKFEELKQIVPSVKDLSDHDYRYELVCGIFHNILDMYSNLPDEDVSSRQFLIDLIASVLEQERTSGIEYIVGRGSTQLSIAAYEHLPARYEEYLLERFTREWRSNWKVLYILIAFLNEEESRFKFSELASMFEICAKRYYSQRDFGYLLQYWILKFGTSRIVRKYYSKWMTSYAKDGEMYLQRKEGFILITTWIRAGGKLQGINSVISQWADRGRTSPIFGIGHLLEIFFSSDDEFAKLDQKNVMYISMLGFYALRSKLHEQNSTLKSSIASNLFRRFDRSKTVFRYTSKYLSEIEILHVLRRWKPRVNFEFFVILFYFQKLPLVNEGELRKSCGAKLAGIDRMLIGHPAQREYREWLNNWLLKEDKGRKSFFHAWFNNYGTLEPFQKQAIDCYYYGENQEELDGYKESVGWTTELKRIVSTAKQLEM